VDTLRDGRCRAAAAALLGPLVVALVMAAWNAAEARHEREGAAVADRKTWLAQGTKNPHAAAHFGVYAFKPWRPLTLFDRGVDAYLGQAVLLEAHRQNLFQDRPAEDRTALQRFGELTPAAVLQILLPLLVVLLAHGAFAGEREEGTLRQVASLGVGGSSLALGKGLGIGAVLALLLAPPALAGTALLARAAGPADEALGRAALLALGYALYLCGFLGLTLAVSAWASSSRLALVLLLGFWIANGLVVPRAIADLSGLVVRTPDAQALYDSVRRDVENGIDGSGTAAERMSALEDRVLKQYGATRKEDLPVSFAGLALQDAEDFAGRVFDRRMGAVWDGYRRQDRLHLAGGLVAPLLAVRALSMGLAGTDLESHRRFATAAEAYRREVIRVLNDDLTRHGKEPAYVAGRELWERVPVFTYEPSPLAQDLRRNLPPLGLLFFWCGLGVALALAATRRLRVL